MREISSRIYHRDYLVLCLVTKTHVRKKSGSGIHSEQQVGAHVTPHSCFPGMLRPHSAPMSVEYHQWFLPLSTPQRYCQRLLGILKIWSVVLPDFINWVAFLVPFPGLWMSRGGLFSGVGVRKACWVWDIFRWGICKWRCPVSRCMYVSGPWYSFLGWRWRFPVHQHTDGSCGYEFGCFHLGKSKHS